MTIKCDGPVTKIRCFIQCAALYLLTACGPVHSLEDQVKRPVYDLIERIIPNYSDQFILEVIPREEGKDVFEIVNTPS